MYSRFFKRPFDILASFLGLVVLSPLFLVLAVCIKLGSPGPVIFTQKRFGINCGLFQIYKFRTMRPDAPKDAPKHLLRDSASHITGIGRFLRRFSLDELPQLWNILKGDMSLVGPRPALWNLEELVALRIENGSTKIRPGLTGLAQINGRDELPIPAKAAYDGEYCQNITFAKDLRIILHTFTQVLSGKGIVEGGISADQHPQYSKFI